MTWTLNSLRAFAVAAALAASGAAQAAVVVDALPTGTLYESSWVNLSSGQNFLVKFSLASDTQVDGFSILGGSTRFTETFGTGVGASARIKVWQDNSGAPATSNLYSFVSPLATIDSYATGIAKVTSTFTPILLTAGDWWMGMSGESAPFAWASYDNGGPRTPGYQRQLFGDSISGPPGIYDLAYQVLGETAVPEPHSWMMMIIGLGLVGAVARRHTKIAVPCG